jgi:hypothetical protein
MTNESKALELADSLESDRSPSPYINNAAAELRRQHTALQDLQTECAALRAQLEQKSERIAHLEATASSNYGKGHADAHNVAAQAKDIGVEQDERVFARIAAMKASQQAPVVQGEPVAHCEGGPDFCPQCHLENRSLALAAAVRYIKNNTPSLVHEEIAKALSHHRQASEPMTDEQIEAESPASSDKAAWFRHGIRVAERHHQIKGKQ